MEHFRAKQNRQSNAAKRTETTIVKFVPLHKEAREISAATETATAAAGADSRVATSPELPVL
jgi:hypothetical protein